MSGTVTSYQAIRDGVRTYGELMRVARPSSARGQCCACHTWVNPTWQLSTRASICSVCCERKADETLGSIVKAERAAKRYVRNAIKRQEDITKQLRFYSHLSGASESFIENEYRSALAKAAA